MGKKKKKEYWSELPWPLPEDLPYPGIEAVFPETPELQADSLQLSHQGSLKELPKNVQKVLVLIYFILVYTFACLI